MSTFIESDQSAPNFLRASPISRSGFVHPDQRVITGLTCICFSDGDIVNASICSSRYLLLNHWAEFNKTCYMTSICGKGVQASICQSIRLSISS